MLTDPNRVKELTTMEKMVCTARWLNFLYSGFYYMQIGELSAEVFLESEDPCSTECPFFKKCPSVASDPYRPTVPIPRNFNVLERFTGKYNVLNPLKSRRENPK